MDFGHLKSYVRRVLCPIPKRYGAVFRNQYDFLLQSQWWNPEELTDYQNRELTKLIHHCYHNVPYYRNLFHAYGYKPNDFREKSDLKKLPFLTRDAIRENVDNLRAANIPLSSLEYHTTGGTSGTPLGLYIEKNTHLLRLAFEWRHYNWGGYTFGQKCVLLRGSRVSNFKKGERWDYDPYMNYLILSTFDMTDDNMSFYADKIKHFEPRAIRGYPSALNMLATFIIDRNLQVNPTSSIKAIFTSSETIYPFQRDIIRRAFGAEIFDLYGNTEQAGRFGECEFHNGHHEFSEYAITEVESGDDGGVGEIVATPFTNYGMPLLRYRTGDCAQLSTIPCPCGRGLRLIDKLEGRMQDIAVLRDGTRVPLTSFFFAVHEAEMGQLRKIQFVQNEPGKLQALVVKGPSYKENTCESLLNKMNMNVRIHMDINIQYVDSIELTEMGKHRFFIQHIDLAV
jgi:phenylacetate-CoA ligase